jgi:hypothetical protein
MQHALETVLSGAWLSDFQVPAEFSVALPNFDRSGPSLEYILRSRVHPHGVANTIDVMVDAKCGFFAVFRAIFFAGSSVFVIFGA